MTDWFEIVCHFSKTEKIKYGCVFLLPKVLPLDLVIWRFVRNCFQNFNNLSETLLKSIMLACKNILFKFHPRNYTFVQALPTNWFQ